ncbi:hypothetical protein D3273_23405 [Lichenibacterium minor]|uniref:Uncharacterized protein n=1 Tax=Lichenibacterium minor TaxID=2316528 RepID=A0A4Q2U3S1_9HYPH|nr:hypothetical protein [Lichenibacterium minor]RYC29537.1 hypothetical protein D3273_23405 [Lichenibacterium minor]
MAMSSGELLELAKKGKVEGSAVFLAMAREVVDADMLDCIPLICQLEATALKRYKCRVPDRISAILLNHKALIEQNDFEGFQAWSRRNPTWSSDLTWAATRSDFPIIVQRMRESIRMFSEERREQLLHRLH